METGFWRRSFPFALARWHSLPPFLVSPLQTTCIPLGGGGEEDVPAHLCPCLPPCVFTYREFRFPYLPYLLWSHPHTLPFPCLPYFPTRPASLVCHLQFVFPLCCPSCPFLPFGSCPYLPLVGRPHPMQIPRQRLVHLPAMVSPLPAFLPVPAWGRRGEEAEPWGGW